MNAQLGVWIDHKKAIIVAVSRDRSVVTRVRSSVRQHGRYTGDQEGGGEKKYEARHRQGLAHFFDGVARHVDRSDELLILGPGESRRELAKCISRAKSLARVPVKTAAADQLTDAQIVAAVRNHYRLPL